MKLIWEEIVDGVRPVKQKCKRCGFNSYSYSIININITPTPTPANEKVFNGKRRNCKNQQGDNKTTFYLIPIQWTTFLKQKDACYLGAPFASYRNNLCQVRSV